MPTPTPQFLHATIMVTDLATAQAFYGGLLGLTRCPERSLNFPGVWYQLGAVQLHLILADQVIDDQTHLEKWGRNRHVALGVTDLASYQAKLQAAGFAVQRSASGRAALFVHDPDGNLIELSELG